MAGTWVVPAREQQEDAVYHDRKRMLSRRQFLRGAFGVASVSAASGLLAACAPVATTPGAAVATEPAAPAATEALGLGSTAVPTTAAATAVPAAGGGLDKVVWVSPRGTLEVMDDYNLWVASKLGYFEEMNLEVELQPGPLEALAVTKLIAENQADVGYPSPGVLLASLDAGMPLIQPWEMMMGNTFNFAMVPDSPINSVQDLEGKTIALGSEGWKVIVDPILVEAGVDPTTVTYLNAGNQWAQATALGQADAALAWAGLTAQWGAQGLDFKYLKGSEFSTQPSNGYAIRKEDLEDEAKLDIWRRFFKANAMAFEFGRLNPRAATQITYEQFPAVREQMTPELALASMVELADLYVGSYKAGFGYGYNDVENWQKYIDTVYELGQIQTQFDAEDVVTNQLIDEANDFDKARVQQDADSYELSADFAELSTEVPW